MLRAGRLGRLLSHSSVLCPMTGWAKQHDFSRLGIIRVMLVLLNASMLTLKKNHVHFRCAVALLVYILQFL